jgi:predicted component of type VI protein secretion system
MDSAFVAAKRGQCGAIYASGTDLKDLVPALRRDQIAFRYLPLWNEPEQVSQARKAIADRKLQQVQQEADRQKLTQDEQRLAAVKANEESVVKARKQAELQQQYGAMARAFEGVLTAEMKDFVESRSNRAGSKYPDIAGWYRGQQQDHWELMTVETSLLDYGIAEFKGRPLETAFARTNIKMRNRILGEYKETCFITGFISDQEFQMDREPVSASCEDPGNTMQTYRQGQRFTSHWLVP